VCEISVLLPSATISSLDFFSYGIQSEAGSFFWYTADCDECRLEIISSRRIATTREDNDRHRVCEKVIKEVRSLLFRSS